MAKGLRYLGQALAYLVFMGVVGYLSTSPAYTHIAPGQALIRLSFSHYGQLTSNCRERSAAEFAKLSPNMRLRFDCPRERSPVVIELEMDGRLLYRSALQPSGLQHDGLSYAYQKFIVPAGRHHLQARLRDSVRNQGFRYVRDADVQLSPAQVLVIDFNSRTGGFIFE